MMPEAESNLFPRHLAFEKHTSGLEQHYGSDVPQDQMAIMPVFSLHLASLGGQEMLQCPEGMLNPAAPQSRPDQAQVGEGRLPPERVVALAPRLVHEDHCDPPIRRVGERQPGMADSGSLLSLPPWPVGFGQEVPPLDLLAIG